MSEGAVDTVVLLDYLQKHPDFIKIADLVKHFGVSRKVLVPMLEGLQKEGSVLMKMDKKDPARTSWKFQVKEKEKE